MITIRKGAETLAVKTWLFPDGAAGVRLDTENHRYRYVNHEHLGWGNCGEPRGHQTIIARIQSSADVMELLMVTDALRAWDPTPIRLVLPTLPYQRQDRRCVKGEAHSLRVFANLINSQGYEQVTVFDPHSDVAGAVIDRVQIVGQIELFGRFNELNARMQPQNPADRPILVSPDAGANKRVAELAGFYGHDQFIRADKLRDLATGKIKEIIVVNPREDVEGRDCLVADDVLDKGGTFLGLSKALHAKGARSVELYVTHGLFTADLDALILSFHDAGIRRIWTTNAYRTDLAGRQTMLTVLDLDTAFSL